MDKQKESELIMSKSINKITHISSNEHLIFLIDDVSTIEHKELSQEEIGYITSELAGKETKMVTLNKFSYQLFFQKVSIEKNEHLTWEAFRKAGSKLITTLAQHGIEKITVASAQKDKMLSLAYLEGMLLGNYRFDKYQTTTKNKKKTLTDIDVFATEISETDLAELILVNEATCIARNWVNEPVCFLNATQLAERIEESFKNTDAKVDIFTKSKIESLKMGGLLAVNKGSIDPPTFTTIEWNPIGAVNSQPIILVGKGVVYDTGGLNIKVGDYMNSMKSDMSGAAAVAMALYAVVKANLPVHVVGLIPATDNRPGGNAYAADDIITMHNGKTVEIINTDAEGRMILADALSYASKYNPELVIDIATLTGAASRAIGSFGMVAMTVDAEKELEQLKASGNNVYERIAEFPFWEEYNELILSKVADIKNSGGGVAGAITAGKFLAEFIAYPWIHLDIAGVAFADTTTDYKWVGGTGVGVRLFYDFIKQRTNQ